MGAMPRPRPPHLQREVNRHGKVVWYVRVGDGPRVRIRGEYGSNAFAAAYRAAIAGEPELVGERLSAKSVSGTLTWLIERYRTDSAAWHALRPATRRQREAIFRQVIASAGKEPIRAITKAHIVAGRERRSKTPHQARHFLDAMRGLFAWAVEADYAKHNPTEAVNNPPAKKSRGFAPWTEDEVDAYYRRWPLGTRQRVWIDVLLFTGLRRGDVARLGRQHVRNGVATIRTEKSGEEVTVTLPILPVLQRTLEAGPTADLAFICGANGRPFVKESFGNAFVDAARKAGVRKSAHGVRKIGAIRAAYAGATVAELNAIFGWTSARMALHYIQEAERARLARQSIGKLAGEQESNVYPRTQGEGAGTNAKNTDKSGS